MRSPDFLASDASPLERSLQRFFLAVLAVRAAVVLARAWLPLGLPEVWRQTDTLGIALRYWQRLSLPGPYAPLWAPALLQSGDTVGVNATEFPILTLGYAPFFSLGPWLGRPLAVFVHVALVLLLGLLNAWVWRRQRVAGLPMGLVMLLVPIFSVPMGWVGKFTPDLLSVTLVCLALGLNWNGARRWLSLALAALAVLLKPTSACLLALPLLKGASGIKDLAWFSVALLPAALYYTQGVAAIRRLQDLPTYFRIESPAPWRNLVDYFGEPAKIGRFALTRLFTPYLPLVLVLSPMGLRRWATLGRVWGVLGLQWIALVLLAGAYLFTHDYYQMSLAPLVAFLFVAWLLAEPKAWLRGLALALWCVHLVELSGVDLGALRPGSEPSLAAQAKRLVQAHPEAPWGQGLAFRSPQQYYPELGLAFGERQNSSRAEWGFFYVSDPLPSDCQEHGREGVLRLVYCKKP